MVDHALTDEKDAVAQVSDPRVAEALARIAASAGVDLNQTPGVFDDVYRRLQSALANPDES